MSRMLKFVVIICGAIILFGAGFCVAASQRRIVYQPNLIVEYGPRFNRVIGTVPDEDSWVITTHDRWRNKTIIETVDPLLGKVILSSEEFE